QQIQSLQSKIQELEQKLEDYSQGGIKILFSGKANAQRIARKVKPRTLKEIPELSIGRNANIYFPEQTYNKLRQVAGVKISRFVAEAVEEKIEREERQKKEEFQKKLIAGYKR
ncbi:18168_t:CDS:2, partial [Racocetra persica]